MSLTTRGGQPLVSGQPLEKTCQRLLLTRSLNPRIPSIHFHLGYIKLQQGLRVPDPPAHFCPFIFTFPLTLSGGDFSPSKAILPLWNLLCPHRKTVGTILIDLTCSLHGWCGSKLPRDTHTHLLVTALPSL